MGSTGVVILVTARDDDLAQVEQLLAADVVVVLARSMESLRASFSLVQAAAAEPPGTPELQMRTDRLEIDLARHEARWDDQRLYLTEQELRLLAVLVGTVSRVWTVAELGIRVWGYESTDGWEVRSAVKRLRRKLAQAGVTGSIEAVRGVGYRWTEQGQPADAPAQVDGRPAVRAVTASRDGAPAPV